MATRLDFVAVSAAILLSACSGDIGSPVDAATAIDVGNAAIDSGNPAVDGGEATGCITCAQTSCSSELTACEGDTQCSCVIHCIDDGGSEGGCKQTCSLDNGNPIWGSMIDCLDNLCSDSC